ncbi:hypothetical protein [Pseudomonas syringae]|uniref:hypothetical protein n=1 Tax=Pseudomonas syringae TaxID=317 RepID=UPI000362EA9E|nr:hypothetical protein [Pseudomonas syringae]
MQTSHAKTLLAEHEPLIGFDRVRIPIDRETIKSRRLLRMIELLEVLKAPDESRTLWQLLLDAGADSNFVLLRDCDDDEQLGRRPALQVQIETTKHKGFLIITHDSDDRGFRVLLQDAGTSVTRVTMDKVFVRMLGQVLFDLVDDGQHRSSRADSYSEANQDVLLSS